MKKDLEKILFNPIRLKVISFLITVDRASFKKLIEISGATKGNMSIQIKKLNEAGFIKIKKQFVKNIPLTICKITSKGKKSFEVFFTELQSYKNLKNGQQ
ncbi:MAG: ArsR family transcriptional regulator [Flavobacteriales bacterium]|jgi:DNA-binding transcriptional ArsR family regulator|nr:ArsR family transcriptional regulator [Flavobacteriales bacterium]|tara:strand:- start:225 stop:524 length:300 start_codon:yes stop_codon:yes gene_type:complete